MTLVWSHMKLSYIQVIHVLKTFRAGWAFFKVSVVYSGFLPWPWLFDLLIFLSLFLSSYQAGTQQVEYCIERLVLSRCDSLTWYKTDYVLWAVRRKRRQTLGRREKQPILKSFGHITLVICYSPPSLQLFSDLYSRVEKTLKVTVMIMQKFLHLSDKITVLWSLLMSR